MNNHSLPRAVIQVVELRLEIYALLPPLPLRLFLHLLDVELVEFLHFFEPFAALFLQFVQD